MGRVIRRVFDIMSNEQATPMSDQRKQAIRLGKLRSTAKLRAAKHWSLTDRLQGIEARLPQPLRSNSTIKALIGYVYTDQLKWKLNDDGSPMTIDDEIAFCRRHDMALRKTHYLHLGLPIPEKKGSAADKSKVTTAELEALKTYVSEEEYAILLEASKAQAADEEAAA